jgi:hypothetical protein
MLSKPITEDTFNSKGNRIGIIGYIDSQCCKNINYKINKRSDIYSLGILLWEISSGHPPFYNTSQNGSSLRDDIGNKNLREKPIEDTPPKYQQLYEKCWDGDPGKRPDIDQVDEILNKLSQFNIDDNNEQISDSLFNQSDQSDQCTENEKINSSNTQTNSSNYYLSDFL